MNDLCGLGKELCIVNNVGYIYITHESLYFKRARTVLLLNVKHSQTPDAASPCLTSQLNSIQFIYENKFMGAADIQHTASDSLWHMIMCRRRWENRNIQASGAAELYSASRQVPELTDKTACFFSLEAWLDMFESLWGEKKSTATTIQLIYVCVHLCEEKLIQYYVSPKTIFYNNYKITHKQLCELIPNKCSSLSLNYLF